MREEIYERFNEGLISLGEAILLLAEDAEDHGQNAKMLLDDIVTLAIAQNKADDERFERTKKRRRG